LGVSREQSQYFVVSERDSSLDALFARNSYNADARERIAFVATGSGTGSAHATPAGFTANRTEFIGRNGTLRRPAGLRRTSLSGQFGAGLDPCAAMQMLVSLQPQQEAEVIFLVGQGKDADEAGAL